MTDLTTTVDTYLTAYGEPDADVRAGLIQRAWSDDAELVDPPLTGAGHRGISDMADAVQSQFAGHRFRRVSAIDAHHGFLRYAWELVAPDGTVTLTGVDVGELAGDG